MRKKTTSPDKPMGKVTRVKNFLPPPHELVRKEETIPVTLYLEKLSFERFKKLAKKHNIPYSRMISSMVKRYVEEYS